MTNGRHRPIQTRQTFKLTVRRWSEKVRSHPKQIRLQQMTRKWASCSTKGYISFNSDLLRQPRRFQEFVIVHELLHLKVPNHGKLFKSLLTAYLPSWRTCLPSLHRVNGTNKNHQT